MLAFRPAKNNLCLPDSTKNDSRFLLYVNRSPDNHGLVSNSPCNCLAYPPGCICGKTKTLPPVIMTCRSYQPQICILYQIIKRQT